MVKKIFLFCFSILLPALTIGCHRAGPAAPIKKTEPSGKTLETISSPAEELNLEVFGRISQDTDKTWEVFPPESGTVKSILVKPNQLVHKNTPLAVMQSKTDGHKIIIGSPARGLVLTNYAKEKDSVDNVTSLMTLADVDSVNCIFDVYERDLFKIGIHQIIFVKSVAFPGVTFQGEIVFISPQIDDETRTVKIKAVIRNRKHLLRFGMLLSGKILPAKQVRLPENKKPMPPAPSSKHIFANTKPIEISKQDEIIQTLRVTQKTFTVNTQVLGQVTLENEANKKETKHCLFDLFESDLSRVREDQRIKIRAAAIPEEEFSGKIIFLSPRVDENTRSIKVRVDADDPKNRLRPGMSLVGEIELSTHSVFVVPLTAIQNIDNLPAVFASQDTLHFYPRAVELGERSGDMVEILSGLHEGESIVSHGGLLITEEYLNTSNN